MEVFRNRKRHFVGGNYGQAFRTVLKSAKNFADSPTGQALKRGTKRQILDTGGQVLNEVLSGTQPVDALNIGRKRLKRKLTSAVIRKVKRRVGVLKRGKKNPAFTGGLAKRYRLALLGLRKGRKRKSRKAAKKVYKRKGKKRKAKRGRKTKRKYIKKKKKSTKRRKGGKKAKKGGFGRRKRKARSRKASLPIDERTKNTVFGSL